MNDHRKVRPELCRHRPCYWNKMGLIKAKENKKKAQKFIKYLSKSTISNFKHLVFISDIATKDKKKKNVKNVYCYGLKIIMFISTRFVQNGIIGKVVIEVIWTLDNRIIKFWVSLWKGNLPPLSSYKVLDYSNFHFAKSTTEGMGNMVEKKEKMLVTSIFSFFPPCFQNPSSLESFRQGTTSIL